MRPRGAASAAGRRVACLAAALLACSGDPAAPEPGEAQEAAEPAPEFTLPDLAGNPVRLSDFRGRTVLIDFWATWCIPCEIQVPALNEFWRDHRDGGEVVVLGVAVDVDGAEVVAPWIEERGVEYPILLGDDSLRMDYGLPGIPALVVVAPDGTIRETHVGLIEREELDEIVSGASPGATST